ncbi:MAG TPA: D-aminoacylase [Candidatus Limnocylindria bacterium]|jgi:N-acyl-D-amino-acid deacylase|nr:D-aminoacylase [Candidatus Limnocylindria bacterium]
MHDVVLRGGTVYDGEGGPPYAADVAVDRDVITAVMPAIRDPGRREIDASGLAVAPGFINMLSWAIPSLIADGRAQSDVRQGVTLEVFGEGSSMGPLTDQMRREHIERQADITYDVPWTTLREGLDHLVRRGVSVNVASFVGATTLRVHEVGYDDRPPTAQELERMRRLAREAMADGALGVGSALIYTPGTFASTDELVALCEAAGGMYISHLRNEGERLLEAIDELIEIARRAGVRGEIYHLKQAGSANWSKLPAVIERVERSRARGLAITADMYPYTAGATGLNATMPPWVQEGGFNAWVARLRDPSVRERVAREMRAPGKDWENLYLAAGGAEGVLLVHFKSERLKPLTGKTLAEIARARGTRAEETAIDLVVEDQSRVGACYFIASEDNLRRQVTLPWMSFGSDEAAPAPEGVFLRSNPHPRAYGTFARVLGHHVRDEAQIPLDEAIRRLTSFPAENLGLDRRGRVARGYFADLVAFDPGAVRDHATYADPHRYASGIVHVFVNGEQVLRDGEHTGARPGRVLSPRRD